MACVVTDLVGAAPGSGGGTVWGPGGASCTRWLGKWSGGMGLGLPLPSEASASCLGVWERLRIGRWKVRADSAYLLTSAEGGWSVGTSVLSCCSRCAGRRLWLARAEPAPHSPGSFVLTLCWNLRCARGREISPDSLPLAPSLLSPAPSLPSPALSHSSLAPGLLDPAPSLLGLALTLFCPVPTQFYPAPTQFCLGPDPVLPCLVLGLLCPASAQSCPAPVRSCPAPYPALSCPGPSLPARGLCLVGHVPLGSVGLTSHLRAVPP